MSRACYIELDRQRHSGRQPRRSAKKRPALLHRARAQAPSQVWAIRTIHSKCGTAEAARDFTSTCLRPFALRSVPATPRSLFSTGLTRAISSQWRRMKAPAGRQRPSVFMLPRQLSGKIYHSKLPASCRPCPILRIRRSSSSQRRRLQRLPLDVEEGRGRRERLPDSVPSVEFRPWLHSSYR